jgi:hypothetical protein
MFAVNVNFKHFSKTGNIMTTERTFNIAGHSVRLGEFKYRFTNGTNVKARTKVLERDMHTDIVLYMLPTKMEKPAAIEWVKAHEAALAAAQPTEVAVAAAEVAGSEVIENVVAVADEQAVEAAVQAEEQEPTTAEMSSDILDAMFNTVFETPEEASSELQVEAVQHIDEQMGVDSYEAPKMTLDEALQQVPKREGNRFLSKAAREERARAMIAAA